MNNIFDREKLKSNRDKNSSNIIKCLYFQQAAEDIIDRLNFIDRDFCSILDLGCRTGQLTKLLEQKYKDAIITSTDSSSQMLQSFIHEQKLLMDEENLLFASRTFDLVTFSLGLHWINNVQKFLSQIQSILKPNGIFIGNFVGGNSLKSLKNKFIETEIGSCRPSYPHISPFINFDHVTPLLSQAGFAESIVDYENIHLEYPTALDFIRELKNIGESAAFNIKTPYTITKQMLCMLKCNAHPFQEQISVINFIASPNKNSIKLSYKLLTE